VETLARRILEAAGESGAELGVEFVGDGRMRGLNRRYRHRDRSTDVLAFPMREAVGPATLLLGDVVISLPTAVRQAAAERWSLDQEVARLMVHGVLHLVGYDHERGEREARRMRRKESAVIHSLGRIPKLFEEQSAVSSQVPLPETLPLEGGGEGGGEAES